MACSCKHNREEIENFYKMIFDFREMFIKRMTVDSETLDRRKKDFNQAIFHIESKEEIDAWNEDCEKFGLHKKKYGDTSPVWNNVDMDMVLKCFDDAIRDYRKSFCDVENCNRRKTNGS